MKRRERESARDVTSAKKCGSIAPTDTHLRSRVR